MVPNLVDAVKGQDIVFVAVQTPRSQYDGKAFTTPSSNKDFDYTLVKKVLSEVNEVATKEQLVVLISRYCPGTVRRELVLVTKCTFCLQPMRT